MIIDNGPKTDFRQWSILYRIKLPIHGTSGALDQLLQTNNQIQLETIMKNTMRNTLLATVATAALMAGPGLASADDTKGNAPAPAAVNQKAPPGKTDQHQGSLPQKSPSATAQAPMKEKPPTTAQVPAKEKPVATVQTTVKEKPAAVAQAPAKDSVAKDDTKTGAPAVLSSEQHVKIRDTLRGEKSERLTNVQFSTTVGEMIPETVHLYALPVSVVEDAPQYRGYEYFLVGDEILIVNPRTMRIIAVIEA
jgi:hypothetical protein